MSRFSWSGRKATARQEPRRVRLQLEALEDRLVLTTTTFTVAAGDVATLIADINAANANGPNTPTTINLTAGTYDFTSADNNTFGPNALPAITGNVTINGNGAVLERDPSLGQNTPFRFFYVSGTQVASPSSSSQSSGQATGSLTLENLTLEGGLAQGGSSGTGGGGLGAGGAIFNQGNLTLNGVTVAQNIAQGGSSGTGTDTGGGSVDGSNPSTTTSSDFGVGGIGSSSGTGGAGGVGAGGGAGSTAGAGGFGAGAGNDSTGGGGLGAGGAIFNMYGTTTLINCTLASNLAEGGQSVANSGDGYGGAVFNLDGTLSVVTSTLANNSTTGAVNGGGAIYNLAMGTTSNGSGVPSTVTLTDSILSDSIASNDLVNDQNNSTAGSAVVNATDPNIVMAMNTINGATTNGTPLTSNPQLGLLLNYGGSTATMLPLTGSPALGAGAAGTNVPTTDQRGITRGNAIDLGAVQVTPPVAAVTTLSLTNNSSSTSSGSSVTLTATVVASSGNTMPAGTVQFVDTTSGVTLGSATVTVVNGQAQATLTTTTASSGDTIRATYTSSNNLGGSSGSTTLSAASSPPTTTNNNGQTAQWLNAVYQVLLHRPIDASGLAYWSSILSGGASTSQVVYLIEQTIEYQTDEVQGAYQTLLGTTAPAPAVSYLVGLMQQGTNFQAIEAMIAGSTPFFVANGDTTQGFLNAAYQDLLGRPIDLAAQAQWSALLAAGYTTSQVVTGIMSTTEFQTNLVKTDYLTYLNRQADPTSLAAYVSALAGGSMNNDMIVATLLGSGEFVSQVSTK